MGSIEFMNSIDSIKPNARLDQTERIPLLPVDQSMCSLTSSKITRANLMSAHATDPPSDPAHPIHRQAGESRGVATPQHRGGARPKPTQQLVT